MSLKCYRTDWDENKNAWKRKTDIPGANKVLKKLRRHFKVEWNAGKHYAVFVPKQRKGTASCYTNMLSLPVKDISLGMIAHEIAHLVHRKRYNDTGHNKKFMKALKTVNKYVTKQHYFDKFVKWDISNKRSDRFYPLSKFPEYLIC